MLREPISAETWRARLDAAIKKYRTAASVGPVSEKAAREEATAEMRQLGLGAGEAERYLAAPGKRR